MNFQKNSSMAKTVKYLGIGVVGMSAALLAGLPSSAGPNGSSTDSSSGGYVSPQSPSEAGSRATTDPTYGERGGVDSSMRGSGMSSGSTSGPSSEGVQEGPSAVGEGFPGPSENPAGSPNAPDSPQFDNSGSSSGSMNRGQQMMNNGSGEGPSAVGEGFPGPSENPAGSPNAPDSPQFDNTNQPK